MGLFPTVEEVNKVKRQSQSKWKLGTANNEWYTPPYIVEKARNVLGTIELDPASNAVAQEWIKAEKYYTKEDDALTKEWFGNVFMNPPYERKLYPRFLNKFLESSQEANVEEGIVLVNNNTETIANQRIMRVADIVCFVKGRIKFHGPDGLVCKDSALQGQMILGFGVDWDKFYGEFEDLGVILQNI